ncbi:MAG: prolipoprotein diacylglyceryl transferase [Candidatus Woesearchaeota archaeon]
MFIHNINPVLFELGPLEIRYYGLVYFLGFLFLFYFLKRQINKNKIKNFDEEKLDIFIVYLLVGMLIGSRIFVYLFWYPQALLQDPLILFKLWLGGMSFHGGLFGAIIAGYLFSKKYNVSFYKLADLTVIPASLFLFFGRIANFINAELVGTVTNKSWCVVFPGYDDCRHPYQIYEGLKNLGLFFGLLYAQTKKLPSGLMFWGFVFFYNFLRFFIDFFRYEPTLLISMGQLISLIFVVVSSYFLVGYYKKFK